MNKQLPDLEVTVQALDEAYAADSSLDFMRDAAELLRPSLSMQGGRQAFEAAYPLIGEDAEMITWCERTGCYVSSPSTDPGFSLQAEYRTDMYQAWFKGARSAQHQGSPASLRFPTMLRKMWSGGEVQKWLDEQAPLYRQAPVSNGDTAALRRVYDVFGLGYNHHISVLLANVENTKRFSDLLHAVEREFFMVPGEPSDEPEDEGCEPADDCLVNRWGAESTEHYVEQFRTALLLISKPAGEPVAHIQFGEVDSGEIGDYEIEPNREVCDALNVADNGNGTIYDLYLFPRQDAAAQ